MAQLRLFDERKLYLTEKSSGFSVLNSYDFTPRGLIGCGRHLLDGEKEISIERKDFERMCREGYGIKQEQIVWLDFWTLPREKRICPKCKQEKNFIVYEIEEWKDQLENFTCTECFIKRLSKGFFESFWDKEVQAEFLKEMELENGNKRD